MDILHIINNLNENNQFLKKKPTSYQYSSNMK